MTDRVDRCGVHSNDNVIVIPSHVSGLKFLENLLTSFGEYKKYPIYVVINEYKEEVEPLFQSLLAKFKHLPITVGRLKSNSFEFGGLLCAYDETAYDSFFLLPHSCEVVDPRVFEIAFEEYRGRSAAFFLRLPEIGSPCWESHIGKYRREILTAIDFKRFQPHNIYDATHLSEFPFTRAYQMAEPTAFVFYTLRGPKGEITEKFGKPRLKMATPFLIKWKTHWSTRMLFKSFPKGRTKEFIECRFRYGLLLARAVVSRIRYYTRQGLISLYGGAPWSPRFLQWRKQLKNDPDLRYAASSIRRARYNTDLVRFCGTGEQCLFEHDLDSNSVVLDVGAFDGGFADRIFHKYHCEIHCFEPLPSHYVHLARRFQAEPEVHLHQVGLSNRTYQAFASKEPVQMQDVAEVFATLDREVDLLKINVRNGEYATLQRMLEKDLLRRCKKVIVEFHDKPITTRFARRLRQEIIEGIEKTHYSTFSYPFVCEGWQRKEATVARDHHGSTGALSPMELMQRLADRA